MYIDKVEFENPVIGQEVKVFEVQTGGTPYRPDVIIVACLPGDKPKTHGFSIPWAGINRITCIHGHKVGVNTGFALFPFD